MTTPGAGWFDQGNGTLRYWDGVAWTDKIAQVSPPAEPAPTPAATPVTPPAAPTSLPVPEAGTAVAPGAAPPGAGDPAPKKGKKLLWLALGMAGVIALMVSGVLVLNRGHSGARGAFDAYISAIVRDDCEAWYYLNVISAVPESEPSLYCANRQTQPVDFSEADVEVIKVVEKGDFATVTVVITHHDPATGEETDENLIFMLDLIDGKWLNRGSVAGSG